MTGTEFVAIAGVTLISVGLCGLIWQRYEEAIITIVAIVVGAVACLAALVAFIWLVKTIWIMV